MSIGISYHVRVDYAVIPTHNRPVELDECLRSLRGQIDHAIVIDNASDPPVDAEAMATYGFAVTVIRDAEQPPNLSRLWNIGIKAAGILEGWDGESSLDNFFIAILNDDVIVPPAWMYYATDNMTIHNASAACVTQFIARPTLKTNPPVSAFDRLTGWAFVLDGADGILANEDLRWWYGDNDIDMKARAKGGTLLLPALSGRIPTNRWANVSTTGILAEQAGKDRATFEAIYGPVPW